MLILQFLLLATTARSQARSKLALSLIKLVASKSASAERGGMFNALVCGASISTAPIIAQVPMPRLKGQKIIAKILSKKIAILSKRGFMLILSC